MIAAALAIAAAAAALLFAGRLYAGPTIHDRIAAAHAVVLCGALAAACIGATGPALMLALLDVAVVLAALKAGRRGTFQTPLAPLRDGAGE